MITNKNKTKQNQHHHHPLPQEQRKTIARTAKLLLAVKKITNLKKIWQCECVLRSGQDLMNWLYFSQKWLAIIMDFSTKFMRCALHIMIIINSCKHVLKSIPIWSLENFTFIYLWARFWEIENPRNDLGIISYCYSFGVPKAMNRDVETFLCCQIF